MPAERINHRPEQPIADSTTQAMPRGEEPVVAKLEARYHVLLKSFMTSMAATQDELVELATVQASLYGYQACIADLKDVLKEGSPT